MSKQLRNEENYKREVLDLYSYISTMCQDSININSFLAASDSASECLERIKVYRVSTMVADLNY